METGPRRTDDPLKRATTLKKLLAFPYRTCSLIVSHPIDSVKPMKIELEAPVSTVHLDSDLIAPRIVAPYHTGEFVSVRPINDNPERKSYFGIMLGDMNILARYGVKDGTLLVKGFLGMPAIFVPELAQLVYGPESHWRTIKSEADLTEISDKDLEQWREMVRAQIASMKTKASKLSES